MKRFALMILSLFATVAIAQVVRTATISWTAPTTNVDGSTITSAITYNLYQGAKGSATKPQVATGISAGSKIVTGLPAGEVCFEVTAVTAVGGESAHSNEACKTFPQPAPNTVTITVQ